MLLILNLFLYSIVGAVIILSIYTEHKEKMEDKKIIQKKIDKK